MTGESQHICRSDGNQMMSRSIRTPQYWISFWLIKDSIIVAVWLVILDTEDCCDDGGDAHENFAEHESRDEEKNMKGQES